MGETAKLLSVADDHSTQAERYAQYARDCVAKAARAKAAGDVHESATWRLRGEEEANEALSQHAEAVKLHVLVGNPRCQGS